MSRRIRTHAMALAKGLPFVATFQLEDKFDGGTFDWTAAVVSGGEWFGADPLSGVPPATITVSVIALPGTTGWFTGTLAVDASAAGHEEVALRLYVALSLWRVYPPLIWQ
jgi:hypothetical protein